MINMKKFIAIMCVFSLIASLGIINVNATFYEGSEVRINTDDSMFSDLMFVKDGTTYIPLRLAFPNLNDMDNKIGMTIFWDGDQAKIRLRYGTTDGGDIVSYSNGTSEPPFVGERRCLDIFLTGNPETGASAEMQVIHYDGVDGNGLPTNTTYYQDFAQGDESGLAYPVYIRSVGNGVGRAFVATDDIAKIAEILGINDSYGVKLYTWVEDGGQQ